MILNDVVRVEEDGFKMRSLIKFVSRCGVDSAGERVCFMKWLSGKKWLVNLKNGGRDF